MTTKDTLHGHWHPRRHFTKIAANNWNDRFRHIAKPPPPVKFAQRSEEVRQHRFSLHDNRHTFSKEGAYFETALGKKKSTTGTQFTSTRNLISWHGNNTDGSLLSTYRSAYRNGTENPALDVCTQFIKSQKAAKLKPQTQTQSDYSWDPSTMALNHHAISRPTTSFQPQKRRLTRRPQSAMSLCRRDTSNLLKWDINSEKSRET
ncbi:hypothetical protein TrispH2_004704 [Trichoplax sp. H2]|nr:hypothetical protein TrispH2_004704 [Trichoplax sp. H2]|eukprot:RDD43790.1 hypothetical protein TrispH2_004704 [Trichoplax sp. H2]